MGKVIMSGIVPHLVAPVTGILASDLAVGSSVYLNEQGNPVEYLVVNQGIPSGSNLYDVSCNGTWLLRKDIYEKRQWHSSNSNSYKASTIHSYLNSTFLGRFDMVTQGAIQQAKIPYVNGTGGSAVASGASGLSTKVFLLGGYEMGWTTDNNQFIPIDGACLSYFSGASTRDTKRIGYLNSTAAHWWLRSSMLDYTTTGKADVWLTSDIGGYSGGGCTYEFGVRPALIVPSHALFDDNTLVLKGVA